MKILFGIPDVTHRELADLEISGIRELVPDCHTIHYGPVKSKSGSISKVLLTIKNACSIKKALRNAGFDLLFLNTAFDFNAILRDCITCLILKPTGIKIFLKLHGSDPDLIDKEKWYKRKLTHWLLNNVFAIGVLSSQEKRAFIERGAPVKEIFVIKNALNTSLYKKDSHCKEKWGLHDQVFTFLFCGRFLQFKGLMDVLEAIKIASKKFTNIHLFCVGDGPEMAKAVDYVNLNNLTSFVTFTGFIPEAEVRYFYSNADALVLPSEHEGFPMAVFQSLAAGNPVITTRISAAADYLSEPENVLWVDYHSPDQIAESMIRLLTDKIMVVKMRANNIEKSLEFTTQKNAQEYLNIFNYLVNK